MICENEVLIALNELYQRVGTQKGLADLAGITQSTICAYLSGKAKIENMPLGVFFKLFRDMTIDYFGSTTGNADTDSRRDMLLRVFDSLSPEDQMRCIAIVIANFPDKIKEETRKNV